LIIPADCERASNRICKIPWPASPILKHSYDLSDEGLCERWVENPYFQYFCGEEFFQHRLAFHRSSLTRWRARAGRMHGASSSICDTIPGRSAPSRSIYATLTDLGTPIGLR